MHNMYTACTPDVHRPRGLRPTLMSAVLTFSAALAGPAAAGTFTPPGGCEGWLTVQSRSCKVSNHYRCEADAAGDQWRVDFGLNGAFFRSRIDYETQWVESHESDGTIDMLEPGAADPASFSELLETGRDSYDFSTIRTTGVRENVRGYDELTGQSVVIDGVELRQTKYEAVVTDDNGQLLWQSRGNEFVHPEWRLFFSGRGQTDLGEGWLPRDFTPVDFIFPGEENFMTTIPLYDCETVTASAPGRPVPEERPDDL